jgi:hypothetical protein
VFFSGPGIVIGLLLAFFINVIVAYFIADYTSTAYALSRTHSHTLSFQRIDCQLCRLCSGKG